MQTQFEQSGITFRTAEEVLEYIKNEDADIMRTISEISGDRLAFTTHEEVQSLKSRHDTLLALQQKFQKQVTDKYGFSSRAQAIFDRIYPHNIGESLRTLEENFQLQQAIALSSHSPTREAASSSSSAAAQGAVDAVEVEAPLFADFPRFVQREFDSEQSHTLDPMLIDLPYTFLMQQADVLSSPSQTGNPSSSAAASSSSAAASGPIIPRQSESIPAPFYREEPIGNLVDEYARGKESLRTRSMSLASQFSSVGRVRGDGDCYFRAVYTQYIEHLLKQGPRSGELDTFIGKLNTIDFDNLPYSSEAEIWSAMRSRDALVAVLVEYQRTGLWNNEAGDAIPNFVAGVRDNANMDGALVDSFRALAAQEVLKSDYFRMLLECDGTSADTHVQREGLTRHVEAEGVFVNAMANALGININLNAIDADYDPITVDGSTMTAQLLFRPGHYDTLK